MSRIKITQSIQVIDSEITYKEILHHVNDLKSKIKSNLIHEELENEFEIIINVENFNNSIVLK